jgi:hypothetical protein
LQGAIRQIIQLVHPSTDADIAPRSPTPSPATSPRPTELSPTIYCSPTPSPATSPRPTEFSPTIYCTPRPAISFFVPESEPIYDDGSPFSDDFYDPKIVPETEQEEEDEIEEISEFEEQSGIEQEQEEEISECDELSKVKQDEEEIEEISEFEELSDDDEQEKEDLVGQASTDALLIAEFKAAHITKVSAAGGAIVTLLRCLRFLRTNISKLRRLVNARSCRVASRKRRLLNARSSPRSSRRRTRLRRLVNARSSRVSSRSRRRR